MFPIEIMTAVEFLNNKYKERRRIVEASYPIIEINIEEKKHRICFQLFYINDEYLEIQNPTYHYYSKISHYDFKTGERRWSRDKGTIFSVINDLKICGLWKFIRNKDFLQINEYNEHTDKNLLKQYLKVIMEEGGGE